MADTLILKLKAEGTKSWRRTFFSASFSQAVWMAATETAIISRQQKQHESVNIALNQLGFFFFSYIGWTQNFTVSRIFKCNKIKESIVVSYLENNDTCCG